MAPADGTAAQRVGPWGRLAIALELALVAYALGWVSQLAAGVVGLDASRAIGGGRFLAWALLATPASLALVLLALSMRGARPASIGLARPPSGWTRTVGTGLAWGAGLYALSWVVARFAGALGLEHVTDAFSIRGGASYAGWIAGGLLAGAFGEELVYRGWLLERVERALAGLVPDAWATGAGVVVGALVFGAQHAYQGGVAVLTVCVLGVGLGLAFLRSGRNLVVPIVAHGVLDVVGLTELWLAG